MEEPRDCKALNKESLQKPRKRQYKYSRNNPCPTCLVVCRNKTQLSEHIREAHSVPRVSPFRVGHRREWRNRRDMVSESGHVPVTSTSSGHVIVNVHVCHSCHGSYATDKALRFHTLHTCPGVGKGNGAVVTSVQKSSNGEPWENGEVEKPSYDLKTPLDDCDDEAPFGNFEGEAPFNNCDDEAPFGKYKNEELVEAPFDKYESDESTDEFEVEAPFVYLEVKTPFDNFAGEAPLDNCDDKAPFGKYKNKELVQTPFERYESDDSTDEFEVEAPFVYCEVEAPFDNRKVETPFDNCEFEAPFDNRETPDNVLGTVLKVEPTDADAAELIVPDIMDTPAFHEVTALETVAVQCPSMNAEVTTVCPPTVTLPCHDASNEPRKWQDNKRRKAKVKCSICSQLFTDKFTLKRHYIRKHKENLQLRFPKVYSL